jgi:hypothetical protein
MPSAEGAAKEAFLTAGSSAASMTIVNSAAAVRFIGWTSFTHRYSVYFILLKNKKGGRRAHPLPGTLIGYRDKP